MLENVIMGGARNLKLGGNMGAKARTQRGNNVFCVLAKCRPYSVAVCIKKMQRSPWTKPLAMEGAEAEALLAIGRSIEAANLPAYYYLESLKIADICNVLQT